MEAFLLACLLVALILSWIYLRDRMNDLETRLDVLERASVQHAPAAPYAPRGGVYFYNNHPAAYS